MSAFVARCWPSFRSHHAVNLLFRIFEQAAICLAPSCIITGPMVSLLQRFQRPGGGNTRTTLLVPEEAGDFVDHV